MKSSTEDRFNRKALGELLEVACWGPADLGRARVCDESYIRKLLNGKSKPSRDTVNRILEALQGRTSAVADRAAKKRLMDLRYDDFLLPEGAPATPAEFTQPNRLASSPAESAPTQQGLVGHAQADLDVGDQAPLFGTSSAQLPPPTAPQPPPAPPIPDLAETLDRLLGEEALAPLRERLAQRPELFGAASLGQALCKADPEAAVMVFSRAVYQCRCAVADSVWAGALSDAVSKVFGLLLARFVVKRHPEPVAVVFESVGSLETAEVYWMASLGSNHPAQFRVLVRNAGEVLIGRHNLLPDDLAECGSNEQHIIQELKRALWNRLGLYKNFDDATDDELRKAFTRSVVLKGNPGFYGTVDRRADHRVLNDPVALQTLTDLGLPVLVLDLGDQGLFDIKERDLRDVIAQCYDAIYGPSR